MRALPALLDNLLALGASAETIVNFVKVALAGEEAARAEKREKAAERQRQKRERDHIEAERHALSRSVTPVTRDVCDTPSIYTSTLEEEVKPKKVSISRAKTIEPDAQPTEANRQYARDKGWDEPRIDSEWERFKNYSIAKDRKYKNVSAGWCNWVTSPFQSQPDGRPNGPGSRAYRTDSTSRSGSAREDAIVAGVAAGAAKHFGPRKPTRSDDKSIPADGGSAEIIDVEPNRAGTDRSPYPRLAIDNRGATGQDTRAADDPACDPGDDWHGAAQRG